MAAYICLNSVERAKKDDDVRNLVSTAASQVPSTTVASRCLFVLVLSVAFSLLVFGGAAFISTIAGGLSLPSSSSSLLLPAWRATAQLERSVWQYGMFMWAWYREAAHTVSCLLEVSRDDSDDLSRASVRGTTLLNACFMQRSVAMCTLEHRHRRGPSPTARAQRVFCRKRIAWALP